MSLSAKDSFYSSPDQRTSWLAHQFPNLVFYKGIAQVVLSAGNLAKQGLYTDDEWIRSSTTVLRLLESVGVRVDVENIQAFANLDSPCVFIGNHMSTLETFVLPCLIRPHRKVTFVVKESLVTYPYFGHVMKSRNPIIVGRANPRDDLKSVFEGGEERLKDGVSIIVFPQTTRTADFDPRQFNSIGVKLARRAGVRLVPLALKTDAWGTGRWVKDFGKVDAAKRVHFSFGEPMSVSGTGKEEHETISQFIFGKLQQWSEEKDKR